TLTSLDISFPVYTSNIFALCRDLRQTSYYYSPSLFQKWNALATWAWDVDCDTCAICRVHLMEECLRCQAEASTADCVVVWGECNHAFHNCCMSQWVRQNNRCPLCQQDWVVQRIGR
uniref:RING-type domain-containing protein n=1 Tax=Angiostrongylus cantonensis TaxID=6313 RepID=A0A0K0CWL5_ANGCA